MAVLGPTNECINHNVFVSVLSQASLLSLLQPEPITGSTRMKGGSATKILLNTVLMTSLVQCQHFSSMYALFSHLSRHGILRRDTLTSSLVGSRRLKMYTDDTDLLLLVEMLTVHPLSAITAKCWLHIFKIHFKITFSFDCMNFLLHGVLLIEIVCQLCRQLCSAVCFC